MIARLLFPVDVAPTKEGEVGGGVCARGELVGTTASAGLRRSGRREVTGGASYHSIWSFGALEKGIWNSEKVRLVHSRF